MKSLWKSIGYLWPKQSHKLSSKIKSSKKIWKTIRSNMMINIETKRNWREGQRKVKANRDFK